LLPPAGLLLWLLLWLLRARRLAAAYQPADDCAEYCRYHRKKPGNDHIARA
jgi:hypothetical protein